MYTGQLCDNFSDTFRAPKDNTIILKISYWMEKQEAD
jgi:hypothetical protein